MYKKYDRIPLAYTAIMQPSTWEKARTYGLDKEQFSVFKSIVMDLLLVSLELYVGYLGSVWQYSKEILQSLGWDDTNEYTVSIVFMTVMNVIGIAKDMPFKLYGTFVLEEKHGFNKQTIEFFFKDQLKGILVGQVLTLPITVAIIYIVSNGGDYFFVWLWLFLCCVTMMMIFIYPVLIAPLFDKYSPLEAGQLRTSIEDLAARLKFPLKQLYVVEGSKRSAHSNAYFYGLFGSKRIVLFDTLLMKKREPSLVKETAGESEENATDSTEQPPTADSDENQKTDTAAAAATEAAAQERARSVVRDDDNVDIEPEAGGDMIDFKDLGITEKVDASEKGCRDEEVLAVLAHELGHWKHNHFTINIILLQIHLLLMFIVFAILFKYKPLYQAVGFRRNEQPILIGLMLVLTYVLSPLNALIQFVMTKMSRAFEYQADRFAKELGYRRELARALLKLNIDNLGFPIFDSWYSAWNHSHPTLFERLAALKDEKKQD